MEMGKTAAWREGFAAGERQAAGADDLRRELLAARAEIELLKANGVPGVMHPVDKAFYDLTVKERDYERVRADRLQRERDEARDLLGSLGRKTP